MNQGIQATHVWEADIRADQVETTRSIYQVRCNSTEKSSKNSCIHFYLKILAMKGPKNVRNQPAQGDSPIFSHNI